MPDLSDFKTLEEVRDYLKSLEKHNKITKELSDSLFSFAIDYNEYNTKLAKALGVISKKTEERSIEMNELNKSLSTYKSIMEGSYAAIAQMNEEKRRGIKIDQEAYAAAKKARDESQQSYIATQRAIAMRELEHERILTDADIAKRAKWESQLQSGKLTQEQFDIRMTSRFGRDYNSRETSGATFEEYRQKQLGRADTVINIAQGDGYTGLGGVADMGISALSKAGPYGAIAAAVLKVVKAGIENILSRMDAAYKLLAQSIDTGNEILKENKALIDTRLQGLENQFGDSGSPFKDIVENLFENANNSATINQKAYIENISKLVADGVAYNVEERALLMTLSDKIATTFEALDKNLTRLIRIQQADMTSSALGREASITRFLNTQFNDTSYMNDMYGQTTAALLEATSQMNIEQADSFMYAVQKWLGSLYALGVSQEAVGNIAQGLSYISTGNINALNSNQGMQTLFAMATENAGMSYSSMLTQGLDAEMVDTLMLSMVNYLGEIAKNTSNQVVKSQWADILNMTVSDLRAVSNLTEADMAAISSQSNLNFSQSRSSVASFLGSNEFFNRYSSQELVANILENALFGKGMAISLDPTASTQYLLQSFHESLMGNGSIIEKFGIWLENTMRAASVDALSELDYIEPILTAAMFGGKATFNEWSDKLFDQFSLSHAFDAGNYTDKWWLNGLITNATGGLAQLYNLAFGGVIPDAINNAYMYNTTTSDIRNRAFGNQIGMLNLENWGATVYNQNRGADFTGLTTAGVGALGDLIWAMSDNTPFRTSVSRSATVYTSAADSITKGFDAVESSANVISSASEETTDQMEKLYNMLFESQSVPIKVFIEGYSDDFKENSEELLGKINDELADRLEIALNNSSNSVYSMISTIQGLKGV